MRIRGLVGVFMILLFSLSGAEAYTVVFKSGKTLEGTLISETASTILIKDASGFQLSLKKNVLNLERMSELNAAQASPAVQPAPPVPAAPPSKKTPSVAKGQKVFTNADVPGATPPAEPPAQPEGEPSAPADQVQTPEKPESPATPVAPVEPKAPKSVTPSKNDGKVFTNDDVVPPEPKPAKDLVLPAAPAEEKPNTACLSTDEPGSALRSRRFLCSGLEGGSNPAFKNVARFICADRWNRRKLGSCRQHGQRFEAICPGLHDRSNSDRNLDQCFAAARFAGSFAIKVVHRSAWQ